jgi:23S rRNA (guanosine2251-2'-O)-methyltransferase
MSDNETWIWGRQPVLEAIRSGRARSIVLVRSPKRSSVVDEIQSAAAQAGVPVRQGQAEDIARLVPDAVAQGVAARAVIPFHTSAADLLDTLPAGQTPFILALDQVQDPHNLGALVRSAVAAGAHGVLFPAHRSAPLSGTVAKVSAGTIFHIEIAQVTNLTQGLADLRDAGVWSVGLEMETRATIYDVDLTVPLCLVVGSEGEGLRRLTRERCDLLAKLPMPGRAESLNASVAGGIALFEVVRQRTRGRGPNLR